MNKKLCCFLLLTSLQLFAQIAVFPELSSIFSDKEKQTYTSDAFNHMYAYTLLKYTMADVSIIKGVDVAAASLGPISYDRALSLVGEHEIFTLVLSGEQIKKITKLIDKKYFGQDLFVFGIRNNQIKHRIVDDRANVTLAVSEPVLKEIFGLAKLGALDTDGSIRAPFIEGVYGKITNLYFIGGPKHIKLAFDVSGSLKSHGNWANILEKTSVSESELKSIFIDEQQQFSPTLVLNISSIDLGFSHNTGNNVYSEYQSASKFPISRGDVPLFGQLFVNSNINLTYDTGPVEFDLGSKLIYLQGNLKEKPQKDKFVNSLNFRLPLEHTYFKDKSYSVSPILNNAYETKLAYLMFKDPKMFKAMRTFEHMLGLKTNLSTAKMDFELGGMLVNDILQKTWSDRLDMGPGLNINGKWSLFGPLELSTKIKSYYLFALPQNTVKDKMAFGIEGSAWLRVFYLNSFSVSLMSDFLFATLQSSNKLAASSIFGITLSYGSLFRLFG
jgi:hypothetical protein